MNNSKLKELLKIYEEASKCTLCEKFSRTSSKEGTYDGLINFFNEKSLYLNIP